MLCAIGIIIFLLNFLTYSLWRIDVDILGLMVFVIGLVITIACGHSMKNSSGLLTRMGGVKLCAIIVTITALFVYSPIPYLNGEINGLLGFIGFILSIILIIIRWKY